MLPVLVSARSAPALSAQADAGGVVAGCGDVDLAGRGADVGVPADGVGTPGGGAREDRDQAVRGAVMRWSG